MNIKTNLLEKHVNFVDTTRKQNKHFKMIKFLFVFIIALFSTIFLLFKYLIE